MLFLKNALSFKILKRLHQIGVMVLGVAFSTQSFAAPDIKGRWLTPEKAIVEITTCSAGPCGKIIKFVPPTGYTQQNTPDLNNKDKAKQTRKVLGLTVLWRLKSARNSWQGRVYDPRRGFSANATIRRKNSTTLEIRGCVRVVFNICEEEIWRKVE